MSTTDPTRTLSMVIRKLINHKHFTIPTLVLLTILILTLILRYNIVPTTCETLLYQETPSLLHHLYVIINRINKLRCRLHLSGHEIFFLPLLKFGGFKVTVSKGNKATVTVVIGT